MKISASHTVIPWPPSLGLSVGLALLLGVAFVYLLAIAHAIEAAFIQHLALHPWIRSSSELGALALNLPKLSLPAVFLAYALSYIALKLASKQRVLHAAAFVVPILATSAWWSYQLNGGESPSAVAVLFSSKEQVLGALLVLLAVALAFQRSARRSAA